MKKRLLLFDTILVIFFISGTIAISFSGCTQQEELINESTVEQVMERGVLRVGMSTFVPWAMKDKTGKLIGFEIDVAARLANDMGVKVEFVPTKWDGIIPALITGKFDIIIGGMGINPKRNLKVNFSNPYDFTGMSLVAHKELVAGFSSLEDFNTPDITIVARLGATSVAAAHKFIPKAKLLQFDDESQAIQELLNGKAHAMVSSAPFPSFQSFKFPETLFLPLKENFTKEPIGFAVKKGDYDTINFLNNWIIFVQEEGWFAGRKNYWFNTVDWQTLVK